VITIRCRGFRDYPKNTLIGFADLEVPAVGLLIHDVCLHGRNSSSWVSLPGKPYQVNGETKWTPVVEFTDPPHRSEFQEAALAAIKSFRELLQ